jgi:hypothetical protein
VASKAMGTAREGTENLVTFRRVHAHPGKGSIQKGD